MLRHSETAISFATTYKMFPHRAARTIYLAADPFYSPELPRPSVPEVENAIAIMQTWHDAMNLIMLKTGLYSVDMEALRVLEDKDGND